MERSPEFRQAITHREERKEEKQADLQANKLTQALTIMMNRDLRNPMTPPTQLVKSRWPPVWTGQQFDKWKLEVEKWTENNKLTEEDKYVDLMESLKRNETIKDFVTKTLVDKVGERRTVMRVLEAMAEKYSKTVCEKIMDTMKKICGFWTEDKVDAFIDRFD